MLSLSRHFNIIRLGVPNIMYWNCNSTENTKNTLSKIATSMLSNISILWNRRFANNSMYAINSHKILFHSR